MAAISETVAGLLAGALEIYAAAGVLFAFVFSARGVQQIDPQARTAGLGFRLIIVPGVVALWPLLLLRWIRREAMTARDTTTTPAERTPHP